MPIVSKKKIVLLGATGSIGQTTLQVLRQYPDTFELAGISGHSNVEMLAKIAQEFKVRHVCVSSNDAIKVDFPPFTQVYKGGNGLCELVALENIDIVVVGVVGMAGLKPTYLAIQNGKTVAIANKESLVAAGSILIPMARKHKARLLPIDSEHNAVFQCLQGDKKKDIRKVILTASGGPFCDWPVEKFSTITPEQALKHPNFSMGSKNTIDSATLANKGLELMEARWLFNLTYSQLDAVIHPEQKVHALVEFVDGSLLAQISPPSMYFPIHYCLFYPDRGITDKATVDFTSRMCWNFETEPLKKFPCFQLAKECLKADGIWPAVFNTSNEIAVKRFLEKQITFNQIPKLIEKTINHFSNFIPETLDAILAVDMETRKYLKSHV